MAIRTITALFDDYDAAARAVDGIEAIGIPHADISIVASDAGERHVGLAPHATGLSRDGESLSDGKPEESDTVDGAGTGATLGTVLGGGAGLLTGLGLLAIPGVGPVVAAGWLVATITGAGVGAATGGLLGGLTGAGLSHAEAETYAEGVRRGGTLVTVRVEEARADRVTALLSEHGSIDVDERAQNWKTQGWTGGSVTDAAPGDRLPPHTIGSDDATTADLAARGGGGVRTAEQRARDAVR